MRTGAFWRSSSASALLIVQATRLGVGPADISRRSYRVSVTAGELAMTVSLKYPGSGCPSEARLDRGTSPHSGDHFYLDEHECLRIREQPATSASPRCPPVRPVRLRVFAPPRTSTIPPPTPTPRRVPNHRPHRPRPFAWRARRRLGLPPSLLRTFKSTKPVESMISIARDATRNVKRWRSGEMAMRWIAAGMLEAEKQFRKVNGHHDMHALARALSVTPRW